MFLEQANWNISADPYLGSSSELKEGMICWTTLYLMPYHIPQALVAFNMLQKYLQAQSLVWVLVVSAILVNVAQVVCCWVFIVAADWGIM